MFSLFDFLTLEDGTKRLSQKGGKELPLSSAYYLKRVQISQDDLVK
jgi:hypothetical protein